MWTAWFLAAALPLGAPDQPNAELHRLFADYWEAQLRRHPLRATYLGDHRYDDRLEDYSDHSRQAWLAERRDFRRRLSECAKTDLSADDRLNADLFETILIEELELAEWPGHLIPIRQQDGPHIDLAMMLLSHPFRTVRDYENYIKRLRAFPAQAEQVVARMKEGIGSGTTPPRGITKEVLKQLARHVVKDVKASEFHKPLARMPAEFPPEERDRLTAEVEAAIRDAVVPTYRRLHDFVRDDYLPACRETEGICHLPRGKEWYQRLAKHHITTDMPPEEIHKIGLRELERIHGEMRGIMKKVGFEGDLTKFADHLRGRTDMHASSAEELMEGHREILRRSDKLLPKVFGRLPRAPYELKAIESFRAPEAPMAYYYPAPEVGDRPAYFYVNVYEPTKRPKYTMEALAYHEAMPGHHLQVSLAQENGNLPKFRRYAGFTVYVEGWGLYSESLGFDLGGYADPYSDYGRLTFDAWRSCRLVVDTGIHYFGWSRQKAIDFMKANTSMTELDIAAEVDRYIAWPGQALAYKIGQLAILDLRREAESKLGPRFDVRAFHDELLGQGALPMEILRKRMRAWVDRQAAASTSK